MLTNYMVGEPGYSVQESNYLLATKLVTLTNRNLFYVA